MEQNNIVPFFREEPSRKKTDVEFHSWFNRADSVETSVKYGFIDFAHKMFTPDFYKKIGDPTTKTCCEIGFGGGRLLLPASHFFGCAHGIDIHHEFDRVSEHMHKNGRSNFALHMQDEALAGSIPDNSVEFFYSFITFQHFSGWHVADAYIKFIERTLTIDGCGILYFGNNVFTDEGVHIAHPSSFEDFPMILHVKPDFVKTELAKHGFNVYECGNTTKNMWSGAASRQFYVKFERK